MTASFATVLGHSRLCFWPEISETKVLGKRINHRTMLGASKTIPAHVLSVLLHALGRGSCVEDQIFSLCKDKIKELILEKWFLSLF